MAGETLLLLGPGSIPRARSSASMVPELPTGLAVAEARFGRFSQPPVLTSRGAAVFGLHGIEVQKPHVLIDGMQHQALSDVMERQLPRHPRCFSLAGGAGQSVQMQNPGGAHEKDALILALKVGHSGPRAFLPQQVPQAPPRSAPILQDSTYASRRAPTWTWRGAFLPPGGSRSAFRLGLACSLLAPRYFRWRLPLLSCHLDGIRIARALSVSFCRLSCSHLSTSNVSLLPWRGCDHHQGDLCAVVSNLRLPFKAVLLDPRSCLCLCCGIHGEAESDLQQEKH
eukprot:scaffold813_cov259-Pinguiococcus_pyrenoidosus.AAC.4